MRFIRHACAAAAALWLMACGSKALVERGSYASSQPKYAIEMDPEGRKHGKETWWHPNGKMKYEAFNRNGSREGRFTAWYPHGTKWYEGFEYHGKPESTLTYWHANGRLKTQALFRDGIQLERKDFDEAGQILATNTALNLALPEADNEPAVDPREEERLRQAGLQIWALRVRQAVEGYWHLPKKLKAERPYRAVAKIQVGRDGRILSVSWLEKSPSAPFNALARQTFKKIKKLPPFPPEVKEETLEVQYEFLSAGKPPPRTRLEAREDSPDP